MFYFYIILESKVINTELVNTDEKCLFNSNIYYYKQYNNNVPENYTHCLVSN